LKMSASYLIQLVPDDSSMVCLPAWLRPLMSLPAADTAALAATVKVAGLKLRVGHFTARLPKADRRKRT